MPGDKPRRIDLDQYMDWIIKNFRFNNWYEADRVLKQHYETTFGIFDHRASALKGQRPWSGIAHLPSNTIGKYFDIEFLIDRYYENGIWDILHIDYPTYAALPPSRMAEVDSKCKKIKAKKINDEIQIAEEERRKALAAMNPKQPLIPK